MARHVNQRALTVNPAKAHLHLKHQPKAAPRQKTLDDFDAFDEHDSYDAPQRLGVNFHLLLTGQSRAGGVF